MKNYLLQQTICFSDKKNEEHEARNDLFHIIFCFIHKEINENCFFAK